MWEGYVEFGNTEIVNTERARTLAPAGGAHWIKAKKHPELAIALEESVVDSGYTVDFSDPTTAPWYDPDTPELSSRFFGVVGLDLDNIYDSTKTATVTENSGDGGVIGAPRRATKAVRMRVFLLAQGTDAMEYGYAWLRSALDLSGCEQGADCDRADVKFFASIPGDGDEADLFSRYLKLTSTTSGPFTVDKFESRGIYGFSVEWTWTSEKPGIFGPERPIQLTVSPSLQLIQDSPINYIPYPSAELEETAVGYVKPVISTNIDTNPGVEVDATAWTLGADLLTGTSPAAYTTGVRVQDLAAFGTSSFRSRLVGNGSTVASGTCNLYWLHGPLPLAAVPAGRYMRFKCYAKAVVLTGSAGTLTGFTVRLDWLTAGGAVVSSVTLTESAAGIDLYETGKLLIPATATQWRIIAVAVSSWQSGAADAANSDHRIYGDAVTAEYFGAV